MKRILPALPILLSMMLLAQPPAKQPPPPDTLRSYADKMHFWVGAEIQGRFWGDSGYQPTLGREFNSGITIVLMRQTQPERGQYNFQGMDRDMKFAKEHDMKLFGQALVYKNETSPDWFQHGCRSWSPPQMDQILKEQIQTVVRHGGDTFYGWEVVNEPLDPAHNGCFSDALGEQQMIVKAFRYAREAAPNALLLLNETFGRQGTDRPKVDRFFGLLRELKAQGAPIDAVGIEMHLEAPRLRGEYVEEFKYFLKQARDAGVEAHVTEMDVFQGHGSTPDNFNRQRDIFYQIVHTCLQDSNCKGFSVWGLGDSNAWKPKFVDIDDTKPLLFDESYGKKPAYFGVLQALKEGR